MKTKCQTVYAINISFINHSKRTIALMYCLNKQSNLLRSANKNEFVIQAMFVWHINIFSYH